MKHKPIPLIVSGLFLRQTRELTELHAYDTFLQGVLSRDALIDGRSALKDAWANPELREQAGQVRSILGSRLKPRRFRRGELLWREGESAGMLVAIDRGRVKIFRLLPTGRAITLYLFGPNDVFGFLPFLDGLPYPAYAQAMDDVDARVMPRSELLAALRAEPELAGALIEFLGRRLRSAFELIQGLSTPGARARVASAILQLIPEDAERTTPIPIKLPVSAHEFAGVIGVVPETFSRALTSLAEEGIIARDGKGLYRVLDLDRLEASTDPPID